MPIRFLCQDCQTRIKVPDGTEGRRVKCPRCGGVQRAPAPQPSAESAMAAPSPASALRPPRIDPSATWYASQPPEQGNETLWGLAMALSESATEDARMQPPGNDLQHLAAAAEPDLHQGLQPSSSPAFQEDAGLGSGRPRAFPTPKPNAPRRPLPATASPALPQAPAARASSGVEAAAPRPTAASQVMAAAVRSPVVVPVPQPAQNSQTFTPAAAPVQTAPAVARPMPAPVVRTPPQAAVPAAEAFEPAFEPSLEQAQPASVFAAEASTPRAMPQAPAYVADTSAPLAAAMAAANVAAEAPSAARLVRAEAATRSAAKGQAYARLQVAAVILQLMALPTLGLGGWRLAQLADAKAGAWDLGFVAWVTLAASAALLTLGEMARVLRDVARRQPR